MTNQASEDELSNALDMLTIVEYDTGYGGLRHIKHKIVGKRKARAAIEAIIRTEKLKLLAEVRERVIEQAKPDERKATSWQQGIEVAAYEDAVRVYEYKMNEQLTKLEAEL